MLSLRGDIISDVTVVPRRIRFKDLKPSEKATAALSVSLRDPEKAKVTSVTVDDTRFSLRRTGEAPEKGEQYEVTFHGSPEAGRISTSVRIHTEGLDKPFFDVPVIARISGNLRYPKKLFFFKRKGEFPKKRVEISTRDGSSLRVKDIVDADKILKVTIEKNNAPVVRIAAEVADPNTKGDEIEHRLVIRTDNKSEPNAVISYRIGDGKFSKFARDNLERGAKRRRRNTETRAQNRIEVEQ